MSKLLFVFLLLIIFAIYIPFFYASFGIATDILDDTIDKLVTAIVK